MKFILGDNLFTFQTGYVGVKKCDSFFKGDLVAIKVKTILIQSYKFIHMKTLLVFLEVLRKILAV